MNDYLQNTTRLKATRCGEKYGRRTHRTREEGFEHSHLCNMINEMISEGPSSAKILGF